MIVVRDGEAATARRSVVAVGVFDGLHRGHQRVVAEVRELAVAHGAAATVATFDPHPATVLDPPAAPLLLGTLDQRLQGLNALGVEQVRVVTFDHVLAAESARSFVERVLVRELRAALVVVGEDFRFGHERAGDVSLLRAMGAEHGFDVVAAPLAGDAQQWSSTAVRRCLAAGDVDRAAQILGRAFTLRGVVASGDGRGRELGYPTANVAPAPRQQLPGLGIYAAVARTPDGAWWPAATSVGTRPQFYEDGPALVESFLEGYEGDLYGATVDVAFLARLRDEASFRDVAGLIAQIDDDVARTREIVGSLESGGGSLLGWNLGQRR